MTTPRSEQSGFSMMEVLITLLLISISILGMVAMQAQSISFAQDSIQRNTAAMLAEDLMEMMRADSIRVLDVAGLPRDQSDYYKAAGEAFPAEPASCSPLPAAAEERLGCWAARAQEALPDAAGLIEDDFHICRSATPNVCGATGSAIEVQLAWRVKDGDCLDVAVDVEAYDYDGTICRYRLRAEL